MGSSLFPEVHEMSCNVCPYNLLTLCFLCSEENATYRELDPDARVIILKALCEARLEVS